jgi:hypothetical protein
MKSLLSPLPVLLIPVALTACFLAAGCQQAAPSPPPRVEEKPKTVEVGKNVSLEVQDGQRRVLVNGYVCLREGELEQLVTRKNTKEHEAIIAVDADARKIHEALNLAGAVEGRPVRYTPNYQPATGQTIKVSIRYEDKGRLITVPGQSWVKNMHTGKALDVDWVFAGSALVDNPLDPDHPKTYLANDGDVICVSNFDTAMLDLPVESSKNNAELLFQAWTERIPPLQTPVVVVLEPVPAPQKDKAP